MRHLTVLPLLFLLFAATCFAQDGVAAKVDDYVRAEMKAQQIPGVSLAVIRNGEIVLARGYGLANVVVEFHRRPHLLQTRSFQQLLGSKTFPYGFGWALPVVNGHRLIEHGGSWQGFKSQISRYVDDKLTVVVFANQARANPATLAHGVAALFNAELTRAAASQ